MRTYRGSLKQCIAVCQSHFAQGYSGLLAIIKNPSGKYYSAVSPSELERKHTGEDGGNQRLVFYGTARELATFYSADQIELFEETPDNET